MPTGGTRPGKGKKGKKRKRGRKSGFRTEDWGVAAGSYDPGIDEQIRQYESGFADTLQDLAKQGRWAKQDFKQGKRDSKRIFKDSMEDLDLARTRGLRTIEDNREQLGTRGFRSEEDFRNKLTTLSRDTDLAGVFQAESANQRGVSGGGTLAAANAIRQRREAEAREPVDQWIGREREDIKRLGEFEDRQESDLLGDYERSTERATEARQSARKKARRAHRRSRRLIKSSRNRARRETRGGIAALEQQATWQSAQNNQFNNY